MNSVQSICRTLQVCMSHHGKFCGVGGSEKRRLSFHRTALYPFTHRQDRITHQRCVHKEIPRDAQRHH